ncbi:MAG TPA: type 1 glutamine amidotransferase domain-containing protein [Lacunisphaera sp.]|nr:type 1 glutamine amidotransferase domain-containing protein [Lacunisphaera sp.]
MKSKHNLTGKRVAILVADGFEQVELDQPRAALDQAGAKTQVVSPARNRVKGVNHDQPAAGVTVDVALESARSENYDALFLPGGVMNPDALRQDKVAVDFVRSFFEAGKPVAAICHGPQILIEADVVRDRTLTSYPSVKTDLRNAGAIWVDKEVVVDNGLVTSRKPDDIPHFNEKLLEEIAEGIHVRQRA